MTLNFDLHAPNMVARAHVTGPRRTAVARLVLDTGATETQISRHILLEAGIDLSRPVARRNIRSATGGALAPVVRIRQLTALGHARTDFPVAAHDMPPAVTYDGLLGLDFFRNLVLTLDFARGRASLRPPSWWRFWN
jgi:predicted aspartyl protease